MSKWKIIHEKFDDSFTINGKKRIRRNSSDKKIEDHRQSQLDRYANNLEQRTEKILQEFKSVHGDKYDYSKVVFVRQNTEVIIVCPEHGEFRQKPSMHMRGAECRKCSVNKKTLTLEDWISRWKSVHGDKYDYSKIEFENAYSEVEIICPEHGSFFSRLRDYKKSGCPKCKSRWFDMDELRKLVDEGLTQVEISKRMGFHKQTINNKMRLL